MTDPVVRLDRIYTRGGDAGETSLGDGRRVSKAARRIEAYGCVDELGAVLGLARTHPLPAGMDAWLGRIQNDLFDLGADLCVPEEERERPAVGARAHAPAHDARAGRMARAALR